MSRIVIRQLSCGMPLIVETIPGVRSAGLTWLVPAGSACDPDDRQGLCAMWSELLSRGAGELDSRAQADAFDALGVSRGVNVGTFHLSISATMLGERVVNALGLLADMVLRPRADAASIEPTRDLCIQSIEGLRDEPQERAMLLLRERHAASPINRTGLGTIEGLTAASRDDLLAHWERRARPGGGVLAVAGAVDADQIAGRLDELLAGWSGDAPEPTAGPTPSRGYSHEPDATNRAHIAIAHDAPAKGDPDSPVERIVNAALSGGMSGRLFTEVREKRSLCYSVYATYGTDRTYARVAAYVGTTPERAQEALDVLWGELSRVNARSGDGGGLEPGEFERAVIGLKSRIVMSGESTGARASALASDWRKIGRARSLEEWTVMIERVTLDQVNEYLARRSMGRVTIVTLGPAALNPPAGAA